uniref:F-box/LRR-repeat protein 15/At3g58940/PEG3-like LRR domain-containing protein n=1 Tax=Lactuca sativa TaxID=4236 RepID=A0A9R1VBU0_LACSA|nr:hypothetical protein LSAT_V11C500255880 [Lactuca sativa]
MSTVRRWIHMAVTRNVKKLQLAFYPEEENEDVEIPYCLVTCCSLEALMLDLNYRGLKLPNILGLPGLNCFLESCPSLEYLGLLDCMLCKVDLLCISSPKLKKLSILNVALTDDGQSGGVKISCPKLVDLELIGLIANNFFFECLDSLNKAGIEPKLTGNIKSVLFPGISHVEHLWIDLYFFSQGMKIFERPKASKGENGVDLISNMPDSILLLILSFLSSIEESVDLDCLDSGCFDNYTIPTVGRWIHMAVTKNVKQLHLMFYPEEETDHVEMPHCLMTCCSLEVLGLNLSYHRLRLTNIMGFPALRDLDLIDVDLLGDSDVVKAFFESFPLLEVLSLISCFMNERGLLYISSPKLKSLRIENENDELMCGSIKICCPKLVDLELRGLIIK